MKDLPCDIKSILLINLGGIGDILLSVPALRLLRKSYGTAVISLLTVPRSAECLRNLNFIDNFILLKKGAGNKFKLLCALWGKKFDIVINMRPITSLASSIKMSLLFLLVRSAYRLGRDTQKRGFFLNIKIPESDAANMHELDFYLKMLEVIGLKAEDLSIKLNITDEDVTYIDNFLSAEGISRNDILVGINPGASWPTRRWPLNNFAELINLLARNGRLKLILTGADQEKKLARALQGLSGKKFIDATGKTDVGRLAALIKRCNLFISNDAGPMHLAAVLGTPLLALFGPGDIVRYDPRRISDRAIVFHNETECAPCYERECKSMHCFDGITPELVSQKALEQLWL